MISDEETPPWLRLHRRASAAFQQLEPHHRGVLLEVLRYTDGHGRINLSGASPEATLLRLLGNTRAFRPILRAALAEGLRIGMVEVVDGCLVFPSWDRYQPRKRRHASQQGNAQSIDVAAASQVQSKSVASAEQERRIDVAAASQAQSNGGAFESNYSESHRVGSQIRSDQRREDQRRSDASRAARAIGMEPMAQNPLARLVAEGWAERYRSATGKAWKSPRAIDDMLGRWPGRQVADAADQVAAIADWAGAQDDQEAAVAAVLDGAFADAWMRDQRFPLAPVAKDPAKYAAAASAVTGDRAREERAGRLSTIKRELEEARKAGDDGRVRALEQQQRDIVFGGPVPGGAGGRDGNDRVRQEAAGVRRIVGAIG